MPIRVVSFAKDIGLPVFASLTVLLSLVDIKVGGIACALLFIGSCITFLKSRPYKKPFPEYFPFLIYVFVNVLFFLLSEDWGSSIKRVERQFSVFLMPLVVFYFINSSEKINASLKTYLIGLTIISLVSAVVLSHFYATKYEFVQSMDKNYLQWKYPHLMNIHPSYWSYYLVVGNIILLNSNLSFRFFLKGILHLVFNLNLFYLSNRIAIVVNLLIYAIYFARILLAIKGQFKFYLAPLFIVLMVLFSYTFYQSPYFKRKIETALETKDERFFLWEVSHEIIKSNYYIFGEGIGNGRKSLEKLVKDKYQADPRKIYKKYDVHNQYIYNYLDYGILGFVSIVYLVWTPLIYIYYKNRYFLFGLSIFLLFLLSQFVESVFLRFQGKVLFSFFYPLVLILARIPIFEKSDRK